MNRGANVAMHKVIFYPVGNGDTSQIVLENGKRILFEYRHLKKTENGEGPEINLKERLRQELKQAKRSFFDVVAFTHSDQDHIGNSTEFFELRHSEKYQGAGRVEIEELWVPAAMILESATSDQKSDEFCIWRDEARYRFKRGEGIRVFSRPDRLKTWLAQSNVSLEERIHLITDAGQLVPGFSLEKDGVEFFCHSPFIEHVDGRDTLRNEASLIFNVRFKAGENTFDYLEVGDSTWEVLEDIVRITRYHKNWDRLGWDIYNIPHHCSYRALSDDKGDFETAPTPPVKELLRAGKEGAYLVSSSHPIEDTKAGREQEQPPHIQAKKCYKRYLGEVGGGKFLVTMEEPTQEKPEPIIFNIEGNGVTLEKSIKPAPDIMVLHRAPRAGSWD